MKDVTLVACPHCHTLNRVANTRLGDDPTCGRCGELLFNSQPITLDSNNFDVLGRAYYLEAKWSFGKGK